MICAWCRNGTWTWVQSHWKGARGYWACRLCEAAGWGGPRWEEA